MMPNNYIFIYWLASFFGLTSCKAQTSTREDKENNMSKTEAEWKAELSLEQYSILREKGTEIAFTGKHCENFDEGIYSCAGCNTPLFRSETKFKSASGWPSFWEPINKDNVKINIDKSYGMLRKEIVCGVCGGHLGHVFNDGPKPTGQRYCVNSASLEFEEGKKSENK